jgi:hypothetical protein
VFQNFLSYKWFPVSSRFRGRLWGNDKAADKEGSSEEPSHFLRELLSEFRNRIIIEESASLSEFSTLQILFLYRGYNMENIFEHGGSKQYEIIKPFIENLKSYNSSYGDFVEFFIKTGLSAIVFCEEFEELEDWVVDHTRYWAQSEVLIFCSLFDSISKETFISIYESTNIYPGDLAQQLFVRLTEIGKERGWDFLSLNVQFMKASGIPFKSSLTPYILPQILGPIDYN